MTKTVERKNHPYANDASLFVAYNFQYIGSINSTAAPYILINENIILIIFRHLYQEELSKSKIMKIHHQAQTMVFFPTHSNFSQKRIHDAAVKRHLGQKLKPRSRCPVQALALANWNTNQLRTTEIRV